MVELFEQAVQTNENIKQEWLDIWDQVLIGSGAVTGQYLFAILSYLGLIAASGTLIILAFHYQKMLLEKNYQDYFMNLIIPLVLVVLLSNNGKVLAHFCLDCRNLINDINQQVLDFAVVGASLEEQFAELQEISGMRVLISEQLQHCEYMMGQEQLECLQVELATVRQEIIELGGPKLSWREKLLNFITRNERELEKIRVGGVELDPNNTSSAAITDGIKFLLRGKEGATYASMAAWMQGYQHFLEASLLITTIAAPLAVGGSLLPRGERVAIAWAIGFFSIGFAKLTFNMMAGLTAAATVNNITFTSDNVPLYTVFGFYAPVFSSALSAGGGMAVWTGMANALKSTVSTTLSVGGRFI